VDACFASSFFDYFDLCAKTIELDQNKWPNYFGANWPRAVRFFAGEARHFGISNE